MGSRSAELESISPQEAVQLQRRLAPRVRRHNAFERVELNPEADPGSEFVGWGGTGDCLDGVLNTDRNAS